MKRKTQSNPSTDLADCEADLTGLSISVESASYLFYALKILVRSCCASSLRFTFYASLAA
jgi:hypothetical protein